MKKRAGSADQQSVNEYIITSFQDGNFNIMLSVYKELYLPTAKYLSNNKGQHYQVKELLWETLEKFRQKCIDPDFKLVNRKTQEIITYQQYIMGIARKTWLKQLSANKTITTDFSPNPANTSNPVLHPKAPEKTEAEISYTELLQFVIKVINTLPQNCQTLFKHYVFENKKMKNVIQETKVAASTEAGYGQFHHCRVQLRNALRKRLNKEWYHIDFIKKFISKQ